MRLTQLLEQWDILTEDRKAELIANNQFAKIIRAFKHDDSARNDFVTHTVFGNWITHPQAQSDVKEIAKRLVQFFQDKINRKYTQWIVNRYIAEEFLLEDYEQLRDELNDFDRFRRVLPHKDINQYKTIFDLNQAITAVSNTDPRSNREQQKEKIKQLYKDNAVKLLYRDSQLKVEIPKTEEAACFLGRGTRWCTASNKYNQFNNYNSHGDLYVITLKNGDKYQFHFKTQQFMDAQDHSIDLARFIEKNKSIKKAFPDIEKHLGIHQLLLLDGNINDLLDWARSRFEVDGHTIWTRRFHSLEDCSRFFGADSFTILLNYLEDSGELNSDLRDLSKFDLPNLVSKRDIKVIEDFYKEHGQMDMIPYDVDVLTYMYNKNRELAVDIEDLAYAILTRNTYNTIYSYVLKSTQDGLVDILELNNIVIDADVSNTAAGNTHGDFWDMDGILLGMAAEDVMQYLVKVYADSSLSDQAVYVDMQDNFGELNNVVATNHIRQLEDLATWDSSSFNDELYKYLEQYKL